MSVVAILGSLLAGCGSRRSTAELQAALRGPSSPLGSVTSTSPTGTGTIAPTNGVPNPVATVGGGSTASPTGSVASSGAGGKGAGQGTGAGTHPSPGVTANAGGNQVSITQPIPGIEHCTSELAPINIGSVGEQSGLAGAAVASGAQTVAAWAAYVNSQGGLRCHPINFIEADDGADPSRNASLTQQLVEQHHVVAFVYNDAPLASEGSINYLVDHQLPSIGTGGLEEAYDQHSNLFPQTAVGTGAAVAGLFGIAAELTPAQRAHFGALSCIEASECAAGKNLSPALARRLGIKVVYNGSASLTAPDFTSNCLAAKRAGALVLTLVLDPSSIHRAAANCRAAGFTGTFATVASVVTADDATDPNLNHLVFDAPVKPWVSTDNAQIALMRQVLAKYAPGLSPVGSPAMGWTSAQLFAASSVYWPTSSEITSADILKAMGHIKHYDVGGMTASLTFRTGHATPSPLCGFEMAIENGRFVTPNSGARVCA